MLYVNDPLIKKNSIEKREYQLNISKSAFHKNTLAILPTGLGKTVIALFVIANTLKEKDGKILFLAPTKPLVEQHSSFLKNFMLIDEITMFTGEVGKKKRRELWKDSKIVVATPQVIRNDVISGDINLKDVSLIIFDEAHRAIGNYAYVFIAEKYKSRRKDNLALGITASPGSMEEKILEVAKNLNIENLEARTEEDEDVRDYVHKINIKWETVPMQPELKGLHTQLKELYEQIISELRKYGLFVKKRASRRDLLNAQKMVSDKIRRGNKSFYQAAVSITMGIKVDYTVEYLESQGLEACLANLEKIIKEAHSRGGPKASRLLVNMRAFEKVVEVARVLSNDIKDIENPKLEKIKEILPYYLKKDSRVIIFTHFRKTSQIVVDALSDMDDVRPIRFVGQAGKEGDKGLTQTEQSTIIKKFKKGEYNVLVATSVAEEGLDIPSTDLVIFYEPVPSEIRTIQRRGRTGRKNVGKVIILGTKGTRDDAYFWSSRNKEKKMKKEIDKLKNMFDKSPDNEEPQAIEESKDKKTLFDFGERKEKKTKDYFLYVDHRELNSEVVTLISKDDVKVITKTLSHGDYVISNRICIERKEALDFVRSIMDGRLFSQIKELKSTYPIPMLLLEGELKVGGMREEAIYGAMASIMTDFSVPIITTQNSRETAKFIVTLVKREFREKKEVAIRGEKRISSLEERQQFIIESLPNVSATLSKRLLEHFGTVKKIFNAKEKDLCKVKGIGKKIAEEIITVINEKYKL